MQKRGIIIDSDDFNNLVSTYPEHPLTKVVPKVANVDEMKAVRKKSEIANVNAGIAANEAEKTKYRGSSVDKKFIKSEFFNENPKFTSIK